MPAPLYMALVHYPVVNKYNEIVTTSVTNLDLHDLGRLAVTYAVPQCFIITPNPEQQGMVAYIKRYWSEGYGGAYHGTRVEAMTHLEVMPSLAETRLTLKNIHATPPKLIATSARTFEKSIKFDELRRRLQAEQVPYLLIFGTGSGLAEAVMEEVDFVLEPVKGPGVFNHLSVRSAASIILDRLVGLG